MNILHCNTGILCIFLLTNVSLSAHQSIQVQPDSVTNAEPTHAHYSLGNEREIQIVFDKSENGDLTFKDDFLASSQCNDCQVFVRLSGIEVPFHFRINNFPYGSAQNAAVPVEFNITPFLKEEANSVELVFDTVSDTYDVMRTLQSVIILREPVHVRDIQITSFPGDEALESVIRIHLNIQSYLSEQNRGRTLTMIISDSDGERVLTEKMELNSPLAFHQEMEVSVDQTLENPRLWSHVHPELYQLQLHLTENGSGRKEVLSTTFGLRQATFKDSVLIINTDTIVPSFMDPEEVGKLMYQSDNEIINSFDESGYNAVMTSNPLPVRVMELFDLHGILVLRKQIDHLHSRDRMNINRPSLIWIE